MATNLKLQSVQESGWLMGFSNLLRKDFGEWWQTRAWRIHVIIWTLLINGIVLAVVNVPAEASQGGAPAQDPITTGVMLFTIMTALCTGIGIIIVMQGTIIDEKKSGTAAWVLSKPVSRAGFILSKFIANAASAFVIMIALQSVIAYIILTAFGGSFSIGNWIVGTLLLALHLFFYLTLTLMLSVFANDRGPVIGIPIAILFLAQMVLNVMPQLGQVTPWTIMYPMGQDTPSLAQQALLGQPLPSILPIIASVIWCIVFVAAAIWRFRKEEF
jgi:ABC-2 type transport system permease protein